MPWFGKIYAFFLADFVTGPLEQYERLKLVLNFCLITALFSVLYTMTALLIDFQLSGVIMPITAIIFVILAFFIKLGVNATIIANIYLATSWIAAIILIQFSGGLYSSILPWLSFIPLSANLMINKKTSWFWLSVCSMTVIYFASRQDVISNEAVSYNKQFEIPFYAVVNIGLFSIILLLSMIFRNAKDAAYAALREKNQSMFHMNLALKEKNDEVSLKNEELLQQQEEIIAQREFIENSYKELSVTKAKLENTVNRLTAVQKELEIKEAESRSMLDSIFYGQLVIEFSPEGNIIKVSPQFLKLLNLEETAFLQLNFSDYLQFIAEASFDLSQPPEMIWQEIIENAPFSSEIKVNTSDRTLWFQDTYVVMLDPDQKPIRILSIAHDTTQVQIQKLEIIKLNDELVHKIKLIEDQNLLLNYQQKEISEINDNLKARQKEILEINQHLEERIAQRTSDLKMRNRQLEEYAFINAHLLRGPMCSILGLIHLLEIDQNGDSGHPIVEHLKKSSKDLEKIVYRISTTISEDIREDTSGTFVTEK